jgi:hypothetical protein
MGNIAIFPLSQGIYTAGGRIHPKQREITIELETVVPMYSIFWYSTGSTLLEFLPSGSDVRRFFCSVRNKPTPQILLFCKEQTTIPLPKFLREPTCSHDPYPSSSHNPSVFT